MVKGGFYKRVDFQPGTIYQLVVLDLTSLKVPISFFIIRII
jgi:hypothetical protein